ncbi:MAG: glycosyltransferase family 39 protein [Holosporales bacterium]|jgi:4-amino-4-deoxy-L-arabinose transferase-like glycosyltransferase|nr:glycosyltransferase family 39 protein [Holosporales bacterium]
MSSKDNKSLNAPKLCTQRGIQTLLMFLAIAAMFLMGNALRPLNSPDEARYTEIPREMLVSGDFITPRLNGVKYFEKPPLFYWMQAGAIKLFGINNWSTRLWHAVIGVLGCFAVFLAGKFLLSWRAGMLSAATLASCIIYYALAKFVCLDMIFSVFFTISLLCFMSAFNKASEDRRLFNTLVYGGFGCMGLAFLTKGLIAVVLPGIILGAFICVTRQWKYLKLIKHPGVLLFLAIALPWHVAVAMRNPDFNYQYFIYEHFIRYTTTIHNRFQAWWFFLPITAIGILPWTGILLAECSGAVTKIKTVDKNMLFLLIWFMAPVVFFSFSGSKLIPYILPAIPAASIIIAIRLDRLIERQILNIPWWCVLIDVTLGCGALFFLAREGFQDYKPPELIYMLVFGGSVLLTAAVPYFTKKSRSFVTCRLIFVCCAYAFLNYAIPSVQENNKPNIIPLIRTIQANKANGDLVFCFYGYYQELPLYMKEFVGLVESWDELEFGACSEKVFDRFLTFQQFWDLWDGEKRIFVIMKMRNYEMFWKNRRHHVLACDKRNIVLTNR